jgi:hypothetical protein
LNRVFGFLINPALEANNFFGKMGLLAASDKNDTGNMKRILNRRFVMKLTDTRESVTKTNISARQAKNCTAMNHAIKAKRGLFYFGFEPTILKAKSLLGINQSRNLIMSGDQNQKQPVYGFWSSSFQCLYR